MLSHLHLTEKFLRKELYKATQNKGFILKGIVIICVAIFHKSIKYMKFLFILKKHCVTLTAFIMSVVRRHSSNIVCVLFRVTWDYQEQREL